MRWAPYFLILFGTIFAKDDGLTGRESTIPVVDLQDYFNPDTKDQFIEDVKEAFHNVGFLGVKNTQVNQQIIENLYDSLVTFYEFDLESKMKLSARLSDGQRGYVFNGGESAKGSKYGDHKEYYMVGRDLSDEELKENHIYKNLWPDFMEFKEHAQKFYNHLEEYAFLFQEIFSLALGEEKGFLQKKCYLSDTSCRMIHYPNTDSQTGQVWAEAHTDINLFTILPKSTAEGLQVQNDAGEWIPVYVKEDAFIINAGDFLELFSNGYFKSTKHRVVRPDNMQTDRYSCVHFVHTRSDASLYPLESWIEKTGGKKKYITTNRWELFMERMADNWQATDEMLKELGQSDVMERLMTVERASIDAMRALVEAGYASDVVKNKLKELEN